MSYYAFSRYYCKNYRDISVIPRTDEKRLPLPRTMLGPLVLNTLALARWVGQSAGSPQYYPRYNSTVDSRYI